MTFQVALYASNAVMKVELAAANKKKKKFRRRNFGIEIKARIMDAGT